jgi:hydroxyethylthiazole kinase-like sugar kinase family protein
MPVYSFEDTETSEEFELTMSYEELKQFLEDNPKVNQTFRMNIVDPVGIGVTKPPADFQKYVLNKVKSVPGANKGEIEKRWHIPKEI